MKYQVFLRSEDKMCSITVEAKDEKSAKTEALKKGKEKYGLDFQVFKIFEEVSK